MNMFPHVITFLFCKDTICGKQSLLIIVKQISFFIFVLLKNCNNELIVAFKS